MIQNLKIPSKQCLNFRAAIVIKELQNKRDYYFLLTLYCTCNALVTLFITLFLLLEIDYCGKIKK